jgi:hypothetical protein
MVIGPQESKASTVSDVAEVNPKANRLSAALEKRWVPRERYLEFA